VLWSGGLISNRFPGVELSGSVLTQAQTDQKSVLCLVANKGLSSAQQVQGAIQQRWPKLNLTCLDVNPNSPPQLTRGADVVLVNFGAPAQDEWLAWIKQHIGFKLGIGVGGTFDFWTGKRKRAPRWLRAMGMEWLWRLVTQPWRTVRVWNALVVFSWHALWNRPVASAK
jgi:N-acetylglucosaminyldiphosphoundecaprenol N-acetyl-beta-D-mannosaminyltransferase